MNHNFYPNYNGNNFEMTKTSPCDLNKCGCNKKQCKLCISEKNDNLPNYDNYYVDNQDYTENYNLPNYLNVDNTKKYNKNCFPEKINNNCNLKKNFNKFNNANNCCGNEIDGIVMDVEDPIPPQSSLVCKTNKKKGITQVTDLTIRAFINNFCYVNCGTNRSDGSFFIRARRTNDVITIRISVRLGANGIKELPICFVLPNLPPHEIFIPICIKINQFGRLAAFKIDPTSKFPFSFVVHMDDG